MRTISIKITHLLLFIFVFAQLQSASTLQAANDQPNVVPALREWKGSNGSFKITASSRICVDPKSYSKLEGISKEFSDNLSEVTGLKLKVAKLAKAKPGDFFLTLDCSDSEIGDEGYILNVNRGTLIKANSEAGVAFATMSVLQILKQEKSKRTLPKGFAKDYPQYEVRGFLIDAGRYYYPPEYVKDLVKQMSYFKLNELHFHASESAAYRFESKLYPTLTDSKSYSNEYLRDLISFANTYGVKVIPEIDTPGHSAPLVRLKPELSKDNNLDLNNPDLIPFVRTLYDEILPTFTDYAFHIGCDEFGGPGSLEDYINAQAKYIISKGKQVRIWTGFHDIKKINKDIIIDVWDHSDQVNDYISNGNKLINSEGFSLYTVPGSGWYPPLEQIYKSWDPTTFIARHSTTKVTRKGKVLGAKMHIWNDLHSGSIEEHDGLMEPMLKVLSEKTWGNTASTSYSEFEDRTIAVGNVPGVTHITTAVKYETKNPADLAAKKPTLASINENSQENSAKAVDVWPWTMWRGGATDWIYVDLQQSAKVNRVVIDFGKRNPGQYKIQVSSNKTKWTDVLDVTDSSDLTSDNKFEAVKAKYVRIIGTGKKMSIHNIEIYGN